ncbi:hypothetical protein D1007_20683 [Hordeum vulgare]|nr:hypothetical protein D1007_20683 [Hordeum vulgare]
MASPDEPRQPSTSFQPPTSWSSASRALPGSESIVPEPHLAVELVASWTLVRHDLLRGTLSMARQLGAELQDVDTRFTEERLFLARGWRQLDVAVKPRRGQHQEAHAKIKASAAVARDARERTLHEADEAGERCEAVEEREWELQSSNAALEQQLQGWRVEAEELALREADLWSLE